MLDKSVPLFDIVMKCPADKLAILAEPTLPEGFRFAFYAPGDARHWCEIMAEVLEFDSVAAAQKYFDEDELPFEDELRRRLLFVVTPDGRYVGTTSAYLNLNSSFVAELGWVAVRPAYQGLGLGRALVQQALFLFKTRVPGIDIYLKTQTWSHKAVELYLRFGFHPMKTLTLDHGKNEYPDALEVLRGLMPPELYQLMLDAE